MSTGTTQRPSPPRPATIRAASKPMSNEARASMGGNACLQRHGSDFYKNIVNRRWGKQ